MNEVMRESYIKDCEIGLKRWNRQIERAGYDSARACPRSRFRRSIGAWAGQPVDPQGKLIAKERIRASSSTTGSRRRPTAPSCTR